MACFNDLRQLVTRCQEFDGFPIKIHWHLLEKHSFNSNSLDYLCFYKNLLIGFLSIFLFEKYVEILAFVDPKWRIKGIFKCLLKQASIDLTYNRIDSYLICCNNNCDWTNNKLINYGAIFDHCIIEMQLNNLPDYDNNEFINIKQSSIHDIDNLAHMHMESFNNISYQNIFNKFASDIFEYNRSIFMAVNSSNENIGKIHVYEQEDKIILHDICIIPKFQNNGYGKRLVKSLLKQWVNYLNKPIIIDVFDENIKALRLYQKCGFIINNKYNYWRCLNS